MRVSIRLASFFTILPQWVKMARATLFSAHHAPQQPWRIVPPKIVRDAAPGDASDFGGNLLDNDH